MNYVPKPRYCSGCEPGLWRVHSHLSHLASPSPTSGILGENASKPSRCLLTHPSYLQPFSPQPSTLPLSPKGKKFFPDFLSVRDSQGKGPSRCSWKSTDIVEGEERDERTWLKPWLGWSALGGWERGCVRTSSPHKQETKPNELTVLKGVAGIIFY